MDPAPKIKLPVPYKETKKDSKSLKKIDTKLKSLNKTGTKKILTFVGSNEVEAMFYLYLFKKYKSNCFLHDKSLGKRILGMSILISEKYKPQEVKETQDQLDNLSKILVDCITNLDTKIIIVPVQLVFSDGGAHANVLIYRKNLNQIEHFEPHGRKFSRDQDDVDNKIIEKWMKLFVLKINARLQLIKQPSVKFIESSEVCPYIDGLQNMEGWSTLTKIADVEPLGYCAAWSMFFTELCLKNPEIPSSSLMNYIFQFLRDNMSNSEKNNYLKSVIRGYAVFINQKINKYFSVFFNSGLTIQGVKNLSRSELNNFRRILRYLIEIEMNLSTNPFYLTSSLEKIQTELTNLNERFKLNSSDDAIRKEFRQLTNKKNVFELYGKFNVVSNPTDSVSYASSRKKPCPEGKEINPKTGRCIKIKTQKVKISKVKISKVKTPKVKTPKAKLEKVEIKLEPGLVPEPVKQVAKSCPPGKEINPKTGRCVKIKITKTKTQKVKKMKTKKMKLKPVIKVCPPGKEINTKTGRCIKIKSQKVRLEKVNLEKTTIVPEPVIVLEPLVKQDPLAKSCPEGKEINPKTGRCVKVKTQKVKKIKIQKVKTSKIKTPKVIIKLEPEINLEPVKVVLDPEIKLTKACPPGKEINPKTGRCVKVKTQKIKKIKVEKAKTIKQKISIVPIKK